MGGITMGMGAAFFASVALQIAVLATLPLTKGYTAPLYTIFSVVAISFAVFILARLAHIGVQLSLLVPISAAVVPLGVIVLSVLAYGEPLPFAKAALLVVACLMIGGASVIR